ncbi:hypothetical protein J1N35_014577 [Gossypium stocksii]|uniref:Uncharacterized protein n=1 Tax=Gossypium stocksii TaxID=47602 RepID=A0A9D4A9W6_9ROSI|nr:hypothetical protein J1N35_014577 [Gossypium stocksii]
MSQKWSYIDSQCNEVDAMSQTWSCTSSPLSVSMPCPRHGLTLTHLQADPMSHTRSYTSLPSEADAMSQTWSYTSTRINADAISQTWSYIG